MTYCTFGKTQEVESCTTMTEWDAEVMFRVKNSDLIELCPQVTPLCPELEAGNAIREGHDLSTSVIWAEITGEDVPSEQRRCPSEVPYKVCPRVMTPWLSAPPWAWLGLYPLPFVWCPSPALLSPSLDVLRLTSHDLFVQASCQLSGPRAGWRRAGQAREAGHPVSRGRRRCLLPSSHMPSSVLEPQVDTHR